MHVLEDGQPGHQPRCQRWPTGIVAIHRTQLLAEISPIDRARQFSSRMRRVDDLIKPAPQQVMLTAVAWFLRSHLCPPKSPGNREL